MALEQLPTADVFVLTFNAQKQLINIPVFATHLLDAFAQHAAALPDLVIFSLQEMAPLAKAFVGSHLLNPYFDAYGAALNRAATKHKAYAGENGDRSSTQREGPFSLIATRNVGMTASMLFARDAASVSSVRAAEVGFGAGDMANKGAVGLRLLFSKDEGRTELTFVTTHLAAMEWNLSKRNKNWASLVSGLVFEDPKKYAAKAGARSRDSGAAQSVTDESQGLLDEEQSSLDKALHNLSIYKPGSHLFVAGDLNYRISSLSPESDAVFPSTDPKSPEYYPKFLEQDQLTTERKAGRTLHGLSEAKIKFPPTYKLVCLPKDEKTESSQAAAGGAHGGDKDLEVDNVSWKWAPHRWPGWCDRVLYRELPQGKMRVIGYDALPPIRTSDHRPVFLHIQVPLIEPEKLCDIADAIEDDSGVLDTRVKLPFPIDMESWQHRACLKKWESAVGWSMIAAQSKQAMAVLATILFVGVGAWWYLAVSSVV